MVARRVTILGSTGSIGQNTVNVLTSLGGAEAYDIEALVAGRNAAALAEQAKLLRPRIAVLSDETALPALREALAGTGIETAGGAQAVLDAAATPVDWCMSAIAGAAGLAPTLAAAKAGATIALANKESMVCAAPLVRHALRQGGGALLPVDSEHNAIFQVFETKRPEAIERIILTASGGPFRDWPLERMRAVTPEQAVAHPNWSMGVGISIDSATMFNKGLEYIEAARLFPIPHDRIEVLVHPQSIVHSMVGYCDGSILAQLGTPDMCTPIAYALGWPDRICAPVERLDFTALARMDFEAPDEVRFPSLRIAREALDRGGLVPCAMNAAKEVAVAEFLARRIGFLDVATIVDDVLSRMTCEAEPATLDDVLAVDAEARALARDRAAHGFVA